MTLQLAVAGLEMHRGNAAGAAEMVEEEVRRMSESDCHPIVGDWLSRAAHIQFAAGNVERATELFGDALRRYRLKEATGLVAALEKKMASLGIPLPSRGG